MPTMEELLLKSLEERKSKPKQAVADLNALVAELSSAVSGVSRGRVVVSLDPLRAKENDGATFALLVRFPENAAQPEDDVLLVIAFSTEGYPARIYNGYAPWDDPMNAEGRPWGAKDKSQMKYKFDQLISGAESELVRLIANELAVAETALASR